MIGVVSQFFDREIPTWKMLADCPQTHSLPKVILKIVRKGDLGLLSEPAKTGCV
jgi:hypothetical protein